MVCLGLAAIAIFVNPKITKNKEYYTKKIVVIIQRLGFFVSSGDREFESRPVQRGPSTMPVNSSAVLQLLTEYLSKRAHDTCMFKFFTTPEPFVVGS